MSLPLFIGLDVGGTSTRVLALTRDGSTPIATKGPGANPQRIGVAAAAQQMARLIEEIMHGSDVHPHAIVAGVAGAGRPDDQRALADALLDALGLSPPPVIHLTHDAALTLDAALGPTPGLVIIAGTGSVVLGRPSGGNLVRAGGWGYLLGDEGSGHVLGLEGLRAVARAFDGGPSTVLSRVLREEYDIEQPQDLIDAVYGEAWPVQDIARLVLLAVEQGDDVATTILTEQTQQLAGQAAHVASEIGRAAPTIVLWGGLTREPTYSRVLAQALHDVLPASRLSALSRAPVEEALDQALALDSGGPAP
jgi:N-acetylglucosamine kinase-like BadF-type ATPase